jgi:ankyrin repeat protein
MIKERLIEEKINSLLTASARGDVQSVDALLQSGDVSISSKDTMGRTSLHIACSDGHEELVKFLLEQKADPTAKDKLGNTPFNDCVRSKHDKVVAIIKQFDPNVTFKLSENETGVLMCQAAFDGRLEEIKRLIVNGADPNESDYDGRTAMVSICLGSLFVPSECCTIALDCSGSMERGLLADKSPQMWLSAASRGKRGPDGDPRVLGQYQGKHHVPGSLQWHTAHGRRQAQL